MAPFVEATIRKVALSIPDGFVGIILLNSFASTMALGRLGFQKKREQEIFPGGKGNRCHGLTMLPPSCVDCLEILGASNSWTAQGLSRPVKRKFYISSQMYIWILFELIPKLMSDANVT